MLQKLADHIADSHIRAAEWEERARLAPDESYRVSCLRLAKGWSHLAKSYAFIDSLEQFLVEANKRGWPIRVEDLPKPPDEE